MSRTAELPIPADDTQSPAPIPEYDYADSTGHAENDQAIETVRRMRHLDEQGWPIGGGCVYIEQITDEQGQPVCAKRRHNPVQQERTSVAVIHDGRPIPGPHIHRDPVPRTLSEVANDVVMGGINKLLANRKAAKTHVPDRHSH